MRIAIGSDHRGFKLKGVISQYLKEKGHDLLDLGTFSEQSCDYPVYCSRLTQAILKNKFQRGIFICKTGIGSSISLNKIKGIRAALVYNLKAARFSRLHNDSNVLVLGSDFVKLDYAKKIVSTWLNTNFEAGRHSRRINQIRKIEEGHEF